MAKVKTAEDVQLASIRAAVAQTRMRTQTFWRCFAVACASSVAIAGFYFGAQVLNKPPWVEVVLAILGTNGAQSLVTWRIWVRLRRQVARIEADESQSPKEEPIQ